jgi:hypothetical protein
MRRIGIAGDIVRPLGVQIFVVCLGKHLLGFVERHVLDPVDPPGIHQVLLARPAIPIHLQGIDAGDNQLAIGVFVVLELGFAPPHSGDDRIEEEIAFLILGIAFVAAPFGGFGQQVIDRGFPTCRGINRTSCRFPTSRPETICTIGPMRLNPTAGRRFSLR